MIADVLKSLPSNNGSAVRMTELGKIKIGGLGATKTARESGRTYRVPEKHDHFTITTNSRNQAGDLIPDALLMEQLTKQYADEDGKLRQIPVRVLSNDIDDILQSAFVWYGGKTVGARSDGKTVTWFNDPANGKRYEMPKTDTWDPGWLEEKDSRGNKLFKLHSVFNCVIAAKEARWGGCYKLRTTSLITFKQLYASMLHISQLTGGVLIGMPLVLVLRPVQVSPDGKASTVYVVHVELRGAEMMEIQRQALEQARWQLENKQHLLNVQSQYRKLLVAPGEEASDEAKDIAAEFHPENQVIEQAPDNYDILDGEPDAPDAAEGKPAEDDAARSTAPVAPAAEAPAELSGGVGDDPKLAYEAWKGSCRDAAKANGMSDEDFERAWVKVILSARVKNREWEYPIDKRASIYEVASKGQGFFAVAAPTG